MLESVQTWLITVALKKVAKRLASLLAAKLACPAVMKVLLALGISVNPTTFEAGIIAALFAGFELLRNWIQVRMEKNNAAG